MILLYLFKGEIAGRSFDPTNMSEEEKNKLWVAFKSGKEEAFSQLFHIYYPQLYQYGVKLVQDEELVKDTIQDTFLYFYEGREGLSDKVDKFTVYLLTSFRRNLFRKHKHLRQQHDRHKNRMLSADQQFAIGADDILIRKEASKQNVEMVSILLNELPPRQREILYLKYYQNMDLSEIAETMAINYQTVANHLYRALKKLKQSNRIRRFVQTAFWFMFAIN